MGTCANVLLEDTGAKQYSCDSGTCQEKAGGQYTDNTCGGHCGQSPPKKGDNTILILGVAALGAYLIFGRK